MEVKDRKLSVKADPRIWMVILFTALVPVIVLFLFFVKWYHDRTDLSRVAAQFVQRQNQIMAYDAMDISHQISNLLSTAGSDAEVISLIVPEERKLQRFYETRNSSVLEYDPVQKVVVKKTIPFYKYIAFLKGNGDEFLVLEEGKINPVNRKLGECLSGDLCDRKAREKALTLKEGGIFYGGLMRHYVPISEHEGDKAYLTVLFRYQNGIVELGLDYRHLKAFLYSPAFPYQSKTDLLLAYENGNYIYLLDSSHDFLIHPRYWHVTGIDRKTGEIVAPVVQDEDVGKGRLNISSYKGEKLKAYFNRLLTKSFLQKGIDIFEAPNLKGTIRVLSVAPIPLPRGQFKESGIFGHVVIGCNVEYFEEPKEQFIPPYY